MLSAFKEMHISRNLYVMVFGESIFNDVIALTAFRSVTKSVIDVNTNEWYSLLLMIANFFGSLGLGYPIGLLTALICKYFGSSKDDNSIFT